MGILGITIPPRLPTRFSTDPGNSRSGRELNLRLIIREINLGIAAAWNMTFLQPPGSSSLSHSASATEVASYPKRGHGRHAHGIPCGRDPAERGLADSILGIPPARHRRYRSYPRIRPEESSPHGRPERDPPGLRSDLGRGKSRPRCPSLPLSQSRPIR
jgi:hypothetical protein